MNWFVEGWAKHVLGDGNTIHLMHCAKESRSAKQHQAEQWYNDVVSWMVYMSIARGTLVLLVAFIVAVLFAMAFQLSLLASIIVLILTVACASALLWLIFSMLTSEEHMHYSVERHPAKAAFSYLYRRIPHPHLATHSARIN